VVYKKDLNKQIDYISNIIKEGVKMGKIVAVHSFRGGTGKSNIVANTAVCIACKGKRVGIVDTDIQSPGIHVLFGFEPENIGKSLNDYLWGKCGIDEAAEDVTKNLAGVEDARGKVYLIPSSMKMDEITRILKEGYEVSLLNDGFTEVINVLNLDYLFIDTHPGIGEETLLSLAISDISLIILRPDNQDYQGTNVTLEVCRRLEVPNLFLVVNKVLQAYDFEKAKRDVENVYKCEVAGVLLHSDDLIEAASKEVFYLKHREHPFSRGIEGIANRIISV
jgi:MinD-like ATPase involved in chromosome partitioning or flagellar assembly